MIGKEKIVFDPANAAETDNVGVFVRAGTDGDLISSTNVGGKEGLDVNVINASIEVTATDLDIRNLTQTDEVTVFQGTSPWVIGDGGGSITVDATDLDIRDLDHSQDNVAIAQGGNTMVVNADGSINVNADISVSNGSDKAEDSAHADADIGTYVLSVREDTLASSTSADGDYQSFKTDSLGALWVHPTNTEAAPADDTLANAAVSVTTTATAITAALATRRKMIVQNADSSKPIYVGDASVTTANGVRLSAGAALEIELAAGTSLYGISTVLGGVDVRVLETGQA